MEIQSGIDLTGKVAVVTGAGRGIGAAIAGAFAEARADIVVADLNNEERATDGRPPDGPWAKSTGRHGRCGRSSARRSAIRYCSG